MSALEWAEIRALASDGVSQRQIATRLGIHRRTVARALAPDAPPRYVRVPAGSETGRFSRRLWICTGFGGAGLLKSGGLVVVENEMLMVDRDVCFGGPSETNRAGLGDHHRRGGPSKIRLDHGDAGNGLSELDLGRRAHLK